MPVKIIMPQLGESVVDGTVGEWLKQVGDTVEEYEPIVRVSTDKVDTEVPAPADGILLEIHIPEGETVDSGVVLGIIGTTEEEPAPAADPQSLAAQAATATAAQRTQATAPNGQHNAHVTPVVARMAAEHNLDLTQIQGTGRNGRITKKDVLAYLNSTDATPADDIPPWEQPVEGDLFKPTVEYNMEGTAAPTKAAAPAKAPAQQRPVQSNGHTASAPIPQGIPGELVQLTTMRRSIAEHMVRSKLHTAPHVTTVFEVDLSAVVAHRNAHKADFAQKGVKLTFTPYFVAASADALHHYPALNARWTDAGIYYQHVTHVGIAVALDDGLIVPVLKNAQDYNLLGLARQVNDLAERARTRKLVPDEVHGGTFSITNHGVNGSLFATPIINQPQSAILGVGAIEKRVKVIEESIAIRPCAYLSLTFDHRLIDGATADNFMSHLKQHLENWS